MKTIIAAALTAALSLSAARSTVAAGEAPACVRALPADLGDARPVPALRDLDGATILDLRHVRPGEPPPGGAPGAAARSAWDGMVPVYIDGVLVYMWPDVIRWLIESGTVIVVGRYRLTLTVNPS